MCVLHIDVERSSSTNSRCAIKLLRGSTDIFAPPSNKNVGIEGASSGMVMFLPLHFSFLVSILFHLLIHWTVPPMFTAGAVTTSVNFIRQSDNH